MFKNPEKPPLYTTIVILAVVFVVGYALFQARKIVSGPSIKVETPQNGQIVHENPIEVTGIAKNINSISLDDRAIFIDEKGVFREKLLLYPGYNIIEIDAKDRFGKKTTKMIEVVLQEPTATSTDQ